MRGRDKIGKVAFMKTINLAGTQVRPRHVLSAGAAAIFVLAGFLLPARAGDPPPQQAGSPAPMTATSRISATVEFGIPAIDRALERRVPRRLATFNDRAARCWHRRILRREIDIDCVYSGFVERVGPISLRADRGRLEAAVPIYGTVSGQGIGRFARLLHGTAEGQLTVYAGARPRLRPDWTVALDMSEGFRWEEPPILRILGFSINLSRFIEPRVREQIGRVEADASAYLRSLDLRDKAQTAWRQAFAAVKIYDSPEIWLKMTPVSAAFAGTRAHGEVLEGALEMTGTVETSVGAQPAAETPPPLPPLGAEVAEPGRFAIVVPVNINYDAVRAKIAEVLAATSASGSGIRDIKVYPSGDKIVFGLRLGNPGADGKDGVADDGWVYLTATPQLDTNNKTVKFPDIAVSTSETAPPSVAEWLKDDNHLQILRQQLQMDYQAALDNIITSANARLTRSLGNGFRSEAHLSSSGLANIQLLSDGLRTDFHVDGDLKILYGL